MDILLELPGALGVLLWEVYRDSMAWLSAPMDRRTNLFHSAAWQVRKAEIARLVTSEEVRDSVLILVESVGEDDPANVGEISTACEVIARMAQQHGNPATRLAFTLISALANPASATLALETAKQSRDLAEYPHAETWFRRAIRIARRAKEWDTYLWAYAGLAVLYMRMGNYPASRVVTNRVLRSARHHRSPSMEGLAFHQFFILDAQSNRIREAYENARAALAAWGNSNPRLTVLAHDVARFWIEHGHFARALHVFESTLPRITDPEEAAIALANISWAAAGTGDRGRYQQARLEAVASLNRACGQSRAAEVFATVGLADAFVGEWSLAQETADMALSIATRRRDIDSQLLAERAVTAAKLNHSANLAGDIEHPVLARQADKLAGDLIQSLQYDMALMRE
jgi:tetratricopeptide (TPR) repeat protein